MMGTIVEEPLFEGCWRHLNAAKARRERMIEVWNAYLDDDPYDVSLNVDEEGIAHLWIETQFPPPPDLPILLGELLYHLRAALDHAIYDTAIHDSGRNPPPRASSLGFPVAQSEAAFRRDIGKIKPLSHMHRSWVEAVQPFRDEDGPKHAALSWLNRLARIDRHRTLHFIGSFVAESNPEIRTPPGVRAERLVVAFDKGVPLLDDYAEVARWRLTPFTDAAKREVEASPQATLDPEIAEFARDRHAEVEWLWWPLNSRLGMLGYAVEVVIAKLELDCVGQTRSTIPRQSPDIS